MNTRTVILTIAAAVYLAVPANAQSPAGKVGVISIQGAIAETKEGQKALQQLDAKFQPKQKEFDQRQSELAQLQDQFNKGASVLSEEKRNALMREIDRKRKTLERDMSDTKDEFAAEQQRVLQGLGQKMMALIEKYAKDDGYSLVLDVSNPNTPILYASPAIDLTQDIIVLYDKGNSTHS
jgi:outer membrane protein